LLKSKKGNSFRHNLEGGIQTILSGNLRAGLQLAIDTRIPGKMKKNQVTLPSKELEPYLKPNPLIECDHEKIRAISHGLSIKGSAWESVLKIAHWVRRHIKMNFKTGFASALQTLDAGEGDCTEHAVLTAALCRAEGIPTRVALGYTLTQSESPEPVYTGHMWNEVYIDGIWIPIDATSSNHRPDPFKIRFFSSSLQSREIMDTIALFPLTRYLEISLLSIEPEEKTK
ncbi:MAG: transglutaminase domain-containing protein, partial [bacterium]|nr:transglutaminase domain-containing protein [bacterium]